MTDRWMEPFERVSYALFRIMTGLLFAQHGAQKLFGWLDGRQVETVFSQMGMAGVIEFFGGLLVALGLLTPAAAAVAFLEMLAAYEIAHASESFWPILNGGEDTLFFAFAFLFIAARGGGVFSLDGLAKRMGPREEV